MGGQAGETEARPDDEILAQLAALTRRLEEQAELIAEQAGRLSKQEREIARLKTAAASRPAGVPERTIASRRAMLCRLLAGVAGAVGALAATRPEPAHATARFDSVGGAAFYYGLAAAAGTVDPVSCLPPVGFTTHGVIGMTERTWTTPPASTGVLGAAEGKIGVLGMDQTGFGVYGLSSDGIAVYGSATTGYGVFGYSSGYLGVYGFSMNSAGVYGSSGSYVGVYGHSASGPGVQGRSDSDRGVWGESYLGNGVVGESHAASAGVSGTSPNGPGVYGTSTSAYGVQGLSQNAYGVSGNSTTQAGVWGSSNNNVGVLGTSTSGPGVIGVSTSSNGVNALSTSGIGLYASCSNGPAGRFEGDVLILGNLTVSGSYPHTLAAPHPDGSLRRLYSVAGAEAYYEDVGQGSIANGVGRVALDSDFAGLVDGDAYLVYLTPEDDCRGLYVSTRGPNGFEVRELQGGTGTIRFSYRVVARPKQGTGGRLDRVTVPPVPAAPRLERVEPLDVPSVIRDRAPARVPDKPLPAPPEGPVPAGRPVPPGVRR